MITIDELAARLAEQVQLLCGASIAAMDARRPWHVGLVSADPARPALIRNVDTGNGDAVGRFVADAWGPSSDCSALDETEADAGFGPATLTALADVPDSARLVLWVPAADPYENGRGPATLARIIARLRAPGGCPWDQKQTTASLRDAVLDEAYEVVAAIDNGDDANLAEELGDVLMAAVLQAQIAEDEGRFTLADVYAAINTKMIRRHPHVFGDVRVRSTDDVVANWQRIKAAEKSEAAGGTVVTDPLARYPLSMPATLIAVQLARRAHQYGTDQPVDSDQLQMRSSNLLDAVMAIIRAGADPDVALRDALRREMASGVGPS